MQNENSEQTQKKVLSLISEKLRLELKPVSADRIGHADGNSKPRPIIARSWNYEQRQECIKASWKLKGSNVYISEEVCKKTLQIRKSTLAELKEKRRQGYIAYFAGCNLIVKRRNNNANQRSPAPNVLTGGTSTPIQATEARTGSSDGRRRTSETSERIVEAHERGTEETELGTESQVRDVDTPGPSSAGNGQ